MKKLLLILLLFSVFCHSNSQPPPAKKVLINGDFEKDLSIGWTQKNRNISISDQVSRVTNLDSDEDFELIIEKLSDGQMKLYQTIEMSKTSLLFSVNAKMQAIEHNPDADYWAAGTISLLYLDSNNSIMGETKIVAKSPHCPWTNSKNLHIIPVSNTSDWHNYSFNLNDELTNLSGINPKEIKKIQVAIMVTTNGC